MFQPVLFLPVLRDIGERGRDLEQVLTQYITFVKPAFEEFCLPVSFHSVSPLYCVLVHEASYNLCKCLRSYCSTCNVYFQTKKYADVIIPRGADNLGKEEIKSNFICHIHMVSRC